LLLLSCEPTFQSLFVMLCDEFQGMFLIVLKLDSDSVA